MNKPNEVAVDLIGGYVSYSFLDIRIAYITSTFEFGSP